MLLVYFPEGVRMQIRLGNFLVMLLAVAAVAATVLPARAWQREPLAVFHQRRARLVRDTGGDGVIVLYSYRDADVAASITSFRQNEQFYYLTGWNQPDAVMLLVPKRHGLETEAELDKEILVSSAPRPRGREMDRPEVGAGRSRRSRPYRLLRSTE